MLDLALKIQRRLIFDHAKSVVPALIRGENSAQYPSQRLLYAMFEQNAERNLLRSAGCSDFKEAARNG
jgi:hypothetical protein